MICPFMFDTYPKLKKLKTARDQLAQVKWPPRYDAEQLKRNEVPV
jgi:hypothetical protein